jgi:hypothetical protein
MVKNRGNNAGIFNRFFRLFHHPWKHGNYRRGMSGWAFLTQRAGDGVMVGRTSGTHTAAHRAKRRVMENEIDAPARRNTQEIDMKGGNTVRAGGNGRKAIDITSTLETVNGCIAHPIEVAHEDGGHPWLQHGLHLREFLLLHCALPVNLQRQQQFLFGGPAAQGIEVQIGNLHALSSVINLCNDESVAARL